MPRSCAQVVSEDEAREMEREIEMASAAAVGGVAAVPPEPAAAVADEAEEKEGFRARLSRKLAGGD